MRPHPRRLRLITSRTTATDKESAAARPTKQEGAVLVTPCFTERSSDLSMALRASEQRLSALLDDRGRLGRDLHDCVLQSLYAIGLTLAHSNRLTNGAAQMGRLAEHPAVDQLNDLIQNIRRMIHGLQYGTLEKFDLSAELQVLVSTYARVAQLKIGLTLQAQALEALTGEEEREILNIVREALSNCVRHAHASCATVSLHVRGTRIRLAIEDNGSGFDARQQRPSGYGLANMRARAKKLGGQLTIRSHVGRGTKILAEFSLEPVLTHA
jgi:two-component system, NarL family, sensor kinase